MRQSSVRRMPQVMRAKAPSQPRKRFRGAGCILVGGALVFLYWFFLSSHFFAITTIQFEGKTNDSLEEASRHLINTNIFRLNPTSLEQTMRQAFPPVATVSVVRGLPHTVRINVQLRTPALRWQSGDVVSILDQNGESFEQGDKPEYAHLPKVVDQSKVALHVGQSVVSPEFIRFIQDMQDKVPAAFKKAFVNGEISETSFHVDALLEGGLRLRFTVQRPLDEQLSSALAIYQAHPDAKTIDVRVGQWGYWKS